MNKNIKILWIDDEIQFLKSHIIFLEKKGYNVKSIHSGEDAIELIKKEYFNIILLDEMMTGMDGLETLKHIKNIYPDIPIIMITKNEEEWLMDEVIASDIEAYLIKPVNPNQIFMACKNILDSNQIITNKTSKEYLKAFKSLDSKIKNISKIQDWYNIYNDLTDWSIKFDLIKNPGLYDIFKDQYKYANHNFCNYIQDNYLSWVQSKVSNKPLFSNDIVKNFISPKIKENKKSILIILDCLRLDQWKIISESLYSYFKIDLDYYLSLIPTTTYISRNAIFSGYFPLELQMKHPKIWEEMNKDQYHYNAYEKKLFKNQISDLKDKISSYYIKISDYKQGTKLLNKMDQFRDIDCIAIVINFIDILTHARLESRFIKEIVPNETAHRNIIKTWFSNSWFFEILQNLSKWEDRDIFITSDHGSTMVSKPIIINADKNTSKGIRYKFGSSLNVDNRDAMTIKNPKDYKLPYSSMNNNYVIAKNNNYFIYPNNQNKFINLYQNSFQHGGISMEEMIVPFVSLKSKK